MTIGIPRALYYYIYYPMWEKFFNELNIKIALSPKTNKRILDLGINYSIDEICISIKLFHGHVKYLIDQGVDYIFIPRVLYEEKYKSNCPKLLGLPDLIKDSLDIQDSKILSPKIYLNYGSKKSREEMKKIGKIFVNNEKKIDKAIKKAISFQRLYESYLYKDYGDTLELYEKLSNLNTLKKKEEDCDLKIGVVGFPYDIYESYLNGSLLEKLKKMGAKYIVSNMLYYDEIDSSYDFLSKDLFWHQSNVCLKSGLYFLKNEKIDGVITISCFGCGLSSIYTKLLDIFNEERTRKPLMHIVIDEHTGEAGILTRLEAFIDLLRIKKGVGYV